MPKDFTDWSLAYESASAGDDSASVRTIILAAETRIPGPLTAFKTRLAAIYDRRTSDGEDEAQASHDALKEAVDETCRDADSTFLLPAAEPAFDSGITHLNGRYLARFSTVGDLDEDALAPKRLPVAANEIFPAFKHSVWFTPDACRGDPLEVAQVLGLPHFAGQIVYRIGFELAAVDQYTPSCLDAGLFCAWQEPPPGHTGRCGMTRHLETGQRIHNEFVVRTGDVRAQDVVLERLPSTDAVVRVGTMTPDYLRGR